MILNNVTFTYAFKLTKLSIIITRDTSLLRNFNIGKKTKIKAMLDAFLKS